MIRIDVGGRTALAYCTSCPAWRELRATRPAALQAGADHARRVHGDDDTARSLEGRSRKATRPDGRGLTGN